ncbi:MAG: DUF3604 domain-containing protein [Myxococcota bacterium]|nr:DUF3604 domain-containing protein [Myxococcota bacterium]
MRRFLGIVLGLVLLPFVAAALYLGVLFVNGSRADFPPEARPEAARRPVARVDTPRILFGDLHVHTVYSADAHLQSVKIRERVSPDPPADACDFARFCSQLDFWSINDHAESLTPDLWRRTVEAVRQCNASAGDPANPDLVSFLGWEWSHRAGSPEEHWGHKNVVLLETDEGRIPARPIAAARGPSWVYVGMGVIAPIVRSNLGEWASFHRYARELIALDECPDGVPVRDLPLDCRESAVDPATLFAKLADWGLPALVIPHGLSWGTTNPAGADLVWQIDQHDPRWQRLLEVYSGHGNSEIYRELARPTRGADGTWSCPEESEGFEPCCARAAALARERCADPGSAACDARVAEARRRASRPGGRAFSPLRAVAGTTPSDWGECDQLRDAFLPAFNYRPRQSAQYGFALASDARGQKSDSRFRLGLIGASDNHRSRPGTGYREFARQIMTDGVGYPLPPGLRDERGASFYYTGGLTAVHAGARDRHSIFEALRERHVYATSGDRILLWFDLLHPDGTRRPMGSEVTLDAPPVFEVRAVGAWEQRPGCPGFVAEALSAERVASLCRGECYHPSDVRKRIRRIEVVRIRPQADPGEPIRELIEDPWRSLPCPDSRDGCVLRFEDPDFATLGRDTVYYVRAIQEPSPAVNGDPLRCERDAEGRCVRARPCGDGPDGLPDDCLAPVEERAWSSPIFADFEEPS